MFPKRTKVETKTKETKQKTKPELIVAPGKLFSPCQDNIWFIDQACSDKMA